LWQMLCTLSCTSMYYFHICKDLTEGEINQIIYPHQQWDMGAQSGDVGGVHGMEALHIMCKNVGQLWARKGDGSNLWDIHWIIFVDFKATWWNRNHSCLPGDVTKPLVIWWWRSEFLSQDVLLLHDNAMPQNWTHHHSPAEHFTLETCSHPPHIRLGKLVLIRSSGSEPADKQSSFETNSAQLFTKLTVSNISSFLVCNYDNEPTKAVLCQVGQE
jgi:hypothetical protein